MKLYTLTYNRLTPAPTFVTIDDVPYANPTQATLRRIGIYAYPLAADPAPTPPEGKVAVPTGYEVRDGAWHRVYRYDDAPQPPPVVYSKYRLVRALQAENVWDEVKAWLQSQEGAWDLYLAAEDISGDEPLLADGIAAIKELLGWTDEKVAQVLAQAEIGGAA
jgi:hypothetical protein